MNREELKKIFQKVQANELSIESALEQLKTLPYEDLGFARLDTHRALRCGFPEIILCCGKTKEEVIKIVKAMKENKCKIVLTKANYELFNAIKRIIPTLKWYEKAKIIAEKTPQPNRSSKKILVITAGTADIPIAEEASTIAKLMGNRVEKIYDVGIAGFHRILPEMKKLQDANVIIVVAGMEGALPSFIAGMVDKPVIAVPTSRGYGANFQGLSALLTMLNSCSLGTTVVNINNGVGAGYFASLINKEL